MLFDYRSAEWAKLRLAALRRDGFQCTNCQTSVRGKGRSRVDHIQTIRSRPDLAWTLSNLRTLCPACDNARHSEKMRKDGVEKEAVDEEGYPSSWR